MAAPPTTWPAFDVVEMAQEASDRAGIEFRSGYSLRSARRSIKSAEAARLLLQGGLKLFERLCGIFHLQQHLAEQFARGGQRARRNGALLRSIFELCSRLHLAQRFFFFALRQHCPRCNLKSLYFYLQGPIVFTGF